MKLALTLILLLSFSVPLCFAQDITVHVIDDGTKKPLKNIFLNLRTDCENPHRPKSLQQKTDASGTAVFSSVSLARDPVCIDLFSVAYAYSPLQLDYVFASPEQATELQAYLKLRNPIITTLPVDVTFHVVKRGFADRLHFMFMSD